MVAKINHSAQLYKVVAYNQQKVEARTARIIGGNRMIIDVTNSPEHRMRQTLLSFENQETRLMQNEYSVNLPTKFVYKGKEWQGWINVVNPFRATIVLGTPGSGKSYAVVNNYIKRQIAKGFAMYNYDST